MRKDNQALIRQLLYYHFKADVAKLADGRNRIDREHTLCDE